jgi:hypothetical protein
MAPKVKKTKAQLEEERLLQEEEDRKAKILEDKRAAEEAERKRIEDLRIQEERRVFRVEELNRLNEELIEENTLCEDRSVALSAEEAYVV